MTLPRVDVVVVAFGPEPDLALCLTSLLASTAVRVRLALVDNGCTRVDLPELCHNGRIRLIRPGSNVGFSGGCNAGVAALAGDGGEFVALVNSDAYVHPDALAHLVGELTGNVGLTTGCVLLADQPDTVNAAGNPMHYLGASWAGGYGEARSQHLVGRDVASISGAAAALRRELWESLDGFDPAFFLYCEDLDLSIRVRQRGLRIRYVPAAQVWHRYEFARTGRKWFYLERNRLLVVLTTYEWRSLLLLAPALLLFELALLVTSIRAHRLGSKLRGYLWLVGHHDHIRRRRHLVQSQRVVGDAALAGLLTGRIDSPLASGPGVVLTNLLLAPYWQVVRRWL